MSSTAVKWAKRQAIEDRTLSALLLELAKHADEAGRCEVAQAALADKLQVNERTIRRLMPVIEALGAVSRARGHYQGKMGRSAEIITLQMEADFTITKRQIMDMRKSGPTGQNVLKIQCDLPDKMPVGPEAKNDLAIYNERARGVVSQDLPSHSNLKGSVTTRIRFDSETGKWRVSLTVDDVTMELGRFVSEDEAIEFAAQARADVVRTSTAKAGTPSHPVERPDLAALTGGALADFLFGEAPFPKPKNPQGKRSSQPDHQVPASSDTNGVGAAGAQVPRPKALAGVGGAHGPSEQDAARARARDARDALRVIGGRDA
jgi:hypothetical protein